MSPAKKKARCDKSEEPAMPIVLRWEIEDAKAKFATKKVESGEYNEGGFIWIIGIERVGNRAKFYVRCGVDHNRAWKCEVNLEVLEIDGAGHTHDFGQGHFFFDESNCIQHYIYRSMSWDWFKIMCFYPDSFSKVIFKYRIHIISSDKGRPIVDRSLFASPNNRSDVVLVIGEEKLHASKEYLAIHSPVFETLFFGDFAEKGKGEVEIKDVIYEEFHDLLQLIYHRTFEITDSTVPHILKLADRFQIETVIEQSKKHLTQSKGIDVVKKLLLADQYNIDSLRNHCLNSFTTVADMTTKLKMSNEFGNFSKRLKAAVAQTIIDLTVVD